MIGFLNYHLQSQPFGSNNIVKFTDYSNLKIIGTVLEKEEYSGQDKYSISLKVKEIEKDGLKLSVSGLTLVNIYLKNCPYQYGDILSIQGKIIQPSSQENFGDFNYRFFLAQKRIFTQINIWQEQYITKIGTEKMNQFIAFSKRIRDRLKNIINILIGPPYNNLLIGILLGERNDLSSEIKDIFLESGIMHILAVSGLHVGIIIAALYFILKLVPLSPPLKAIIIIISLIFYSSLLGFRSSVLRATLMLFPIIMGNLLNRKRNVYLSFYFSAWIILLFNPLLLYEAGFLLSFTVTFFMIYLPPILYKIFSGFNPYLKKPLSLSLAAWIGIFPLSAYYFNKVSLIGVIANLFIIPLVGIVVITGFLFTIIGFINLSLANILAKITYIILISINWLAKIFSSLPLAYINIKQPSIIAIFMFYLLIFCIFKIIYPKMCLLQIRRRNLITVLMVIIIIIFFQQSYPSGELIVTFINVGEGDCILIETPQGKNLLIDGGGTPFSNFDIGNKIVVPYLRRKGIQHIHLIILTHPDLDHLEGLMTVVKEMKVSNFVDSGIVSQNIEYQKLINLINEKGISYGSLIAGDQIILSKNLEILVLNPTSHPDFYSKTDLNNSSLVLKLFYKNARILFTGDIEEEAEKEILLNQYTIRSDILKIAHHGSLSSTSPDFLEKVNPKIAIISVGDNNFNHPHPLIINRLEDYGIKVYRTDQNGTIVIQTDGDRYKLNTLR